MSVLPSDYDSDPDRFLSSGTPGDQVEVERWDGHLNILSAVGHAAAFLRIHGLSDADAAAAASMLVRAASAASLRWGS